MSRKGFPESYDVRALLAFLAALKAGEPEVRAPMYSHLTYDVVDGDEIVLRSPEIVIVEGVNVLQTPARRGRTEASLVVSDFFDFSIYVDASEHDLEDWYVTRLLLLRETSLHDPRSYFNFLTRSSEDETRKLRLGGLARDQPREPAREHRAEPGTRAPAAREGPRSPREARTPPQAVVAIRASSCVACSSVRTPRRPNHANSAIHAGQLVAVDEVARRARSARGARPTRPSRRARRRARGAGRREVGQVDECRDRLGRRFEDRVDGAREVGIAADRRAEQQPERGAVADRELEVGPESGLDPLSPGRRAGGRLGQAGRAGGGRCLRAARRRARACSGSAGTAPAW